MTGILAEASAGLKDVGALGASKDGPSPAALVGNTLSYQNNTLMPIFSRTCLCDLNCCNQAALEALVSGYLQGQIGPLPFRAPSAGSRVTPGSWPVALCALGCPGAGQLLPFREPLRRGVMGGGDWRQQLRGQWCKRNSRSLRPSTLPNGPGAHRCEESSSPHSLQTPCLQEQYLRSQL